MPPPRAGRQIDADRLVVVYDDLDTDVGQIRFRTKGGHGGHNGMRNIIDRLGGTKDFCRLRVGIGRPENGMVRPAAPRAPRPRGRSSAADRRPARPARSQMPVAAYVLQRFGRGERKELVEYSIDASVDTLLKLIEKGAELAVSQQ